MYLGRLNFLIPFEKQSISSKTKSLKTRYEMSPGKHGTVTQISKKKIPVITGMFGREGTVFKLQRKAIRTI